MMVDFEELDATVTLAQQMQAQEGPVVLISVFSHPEFQSRIPDYPPSAVARPHLIKKPAVASHCVA